MSRHKQRKFNELAGFENFYANPFSFKGVWSEKVFSNQRPITLELGCGKGEFSLQLGKQFPERNFIGIDLDGARLWRAAKNALAECLSNVAFIQMNIDKIEEAFAPGEVSEIWIPFPDPYPKPSKWKKRLISTVFLERYKKIIQNGSILHFKTDNSHLFDFGIKSIQESGYLIISQTNDLYHSPLQNEFNTIPSYFESIFMAKGESIKYVMFKFVDEK
ncbi:MAG TPA: tRNA (guanosine(46)-N7)-methyltransferase TrmB [Bacteroidia bacterium]|nr:tRNA (guanosine(46)-N7)-methyltransferase TrmB [Sphingobacteriales bacterium]HPD63974.1 tRNA (guanosine(46)-N7)-methyltransferase TrmB [Bacteroidia bacterium]HRS57665.1 tRNA (guanosine(46)-N7)-methyltransferase TrmB [Bacteroidia bacterium]HRU67963.1 tRNA (guanosine(46)-N7)-methyltransferase TrmB [Bacteroidia bacterium]